MTELTLGVRITADGAQLVSVTRTGAAATKELKESLAGANSSAAQLKGSMDGAASATTRMTGTVNAARGAISQMATAQEQAGQATRRAAQETLSSSAIVARAQNRQRIGFQQLGVQAGDFFTQIASGGNAFIAFAQQSQQAVGALQLMGGEGAATRGALARLVSFMGGPMGIVLGATIPLIGLLASKLFESSEASDSARESSIDFSSSLVAQTGVVGDLTAGIEQLNQATRGLISTQALLIDNVRGAAAVTARSIEGQIGTIDRELGRLRARQLGPVADFFFGGFTSQTVDAAQIRRLEAQRGNLSARLRGAQASLAEAQTATEARAARESADPDLRARGEIERERARLLERRRITLENERGVPLQIGGGPELIQATEFNRQLVELERRERALSADGGRRTRGRGGDAARRATRLNEQDADWARSTEEAVNRINDRWGEQPRLIAQAGAATRELNRVIEDAQERLARRGIGADEAAALRDRISEARDAITTVAEGAERPWRAMIAAGEQQRSIQQLVLQGREREAEVLQRIQRLEADGIDVTAQRRTEIEQIVALEDDINQLLEKRSLVVDAYGASISDIRGSLEDLLAGGSAGDFVANLETTFRRLQSRLTVERLFGDGLRQLEQRIRRETGFEGVVEALGQQTSVAADHMTDAGAAVTEFAVSARDAASSLGRIGTNIASEPGGATAEVGRQIDALTRTLGEAITQGIHSDLRQREQQRDQPGGEDLVVTAPSRSSSGRVTLATMSPGDFMREAARVLVSPLRDGLERLDRSLGTNIAGPLAGALEGGIAGRFIAGDVGAVLGAVRGSGLIGGRAGKRLDAAFGGAQQGYEIAQLGKALGLKTSSTGGSIGGAVGAATGIPGADIVGSIVGSVLGGLLKKTPKGTLSISQDGATYAGSGKLRESLTSAGSAVNSTLASIAEQLGAEVGPFSGSIRQKGKKVYANGSRVADLEAAASKVLSDALTGGALTGISGAVRKALGSSSEIDKAVKEALKVQQVEDLLGGIGAAMTKQFRLFETQAKDRVRIAEQYGFDVVEIEKRNAEDRAKIADQILTERVGALRDLLSDISIGDLFEGTAADRRAALLVEIAKATSDAEAGKDGAAAKLADLQRRLIDTSRSAYGTAGSEYATDRSNTISTAERIIALENERVKAAQDAAIGTKAAVEAGNALASEGNDLLARIAAGIEQLTITGGLLPSSPIGISRNVEL